MALACTTNCFFTKKYTTKEQPWMRRIDQNRKPSRSATSVVFSARTHPTIWKPDLLELISPPYTYDSHYQQLEELKRNAKGLLTSSLDPGVLLNNIDAMQRLGVAYHFESEIKEALGVIHSFAPSDLFTTALQFRLLRQNGFHASSDIFSKFRSRNGQFVDSLRQDTETLLSLYEASYLAMQGEGILEEAKDFSVQHLKSSLGKLDTNLLKKVKQSLEIPLHRKLPIVEAQSYIEHYQISNSKSLTLLQLAKLDHNLAQSVYQQELKELTQWWRKLGFKDKLNFVRDCLMENYIWLVGVLSEPQYSKCRIAITKYACMVTTIDDVFEACGQLHELESFITALNRWEIKEISDMPESMKLCYVALLNFANELTYDALRNHGLSISPDIQQEWVRICRSFLLEAQWFGNNHVPTTEQYLNNAWISFGGPGMAVHAYPMLGCTLSEEILNGLKNSKLPHLSSLIARLWNDLKDSKDESKREDVAKYVECFMAEKGGSKEEAENHTRDLIDDLWKKMNEEVAKSSLPNPVVKILLNMARGAQFIYQGMST